MSKLDPDRTVPDLLALIEDAINNHPRTLQKAIGPSSLGSACDRCLINELADMLTEEHAPWLPTLGHAVHEWLEGVILRHLMVTGSDRYISEGKVTVGMVGGVWVTGNSDVFDTWTNTVVDFKLVGTTTVRKVRKAGDCGGDCNCSVSLTYRRQGQLYGKGWEDAGYDVKSVAVWGLPRNGFHITDGFVHQEPYDRNVALLTLDRADQFARRINRYGHDEVLAKAPPHTGTEFSCPDPKAEAKIAAQLEGLIPPPAGATVPVSTTEGTES